MLLRVTSKPHGRVGGEGSDETAVLNDVATYFDIRESGALVCSSGQRHFSHQIDGEGERDGHICRGRDGETHNDTHTCMHAHRARAREIEIYRDR